MKRIIIFLGLVSFLLSNNTFARENIREVFKNNQAIIYTINIRNFGAVDKNLDGIIDVEKGDIRGTFLNAKEKLSDLKKEGINTIYVLPITPAGKLKALGSAGSLYAMDDFDEINPQLDDENNNLTALQEAKEFIEKAHELDLNVIVDLPSCGSYDLSIKKPNWFLFDENGDSLTPADWTDVRLFKVYNEDNTLNKEVLENFKKFVDLAQNIGFDGIRADVAAIKPYGFWKEVIDYARNKNANFLFLAEASPEWDNPAVNGIKSYSSIEELLKSGFDSYYGSFSNFKNIKTKAEFDNKIEKNLKILSNNKNKSIIGAFATHDQQAPILKSKNYWNMILWLNITLPLNSYFLDGFSVGDDYTYDYEYKKAQNSLTDDDYYYVHSGMFDIFNLTGPVRIKYPKFKKEFLNAIAFKNNNKDFIKNAKYKSIKTNNTKVFAYTRTYLNKELIAVGSLDEDNIQELTIENKKLKKEHLFTLLNAKTIPQINNNKINIKLEPMELQVYLINTKEKKSFK